MATTLGRDLATRLGTELADMPGPPFDATMMYGLTAFSAASFYEAAVGAWEVGDATNGFGAVLIVQPTATWTTGQYLLSNAAGANPQSGFSMFATYVSSLPALGASMAPTTASSSSAPTRFVLGTDLNKLIVFGVMLDKTANRWRFFADRQEHSAPGTSATTYVPASTAPPRLGRGNSLANPLAVSTLNVFSWLTFRGTMSDANWWALFDQTRALGDVPTSIAGATLTQRHSVRDELAKANQAAIAGRTAPAEINDTVTNAVSNRFVRQGSPAVVIANPATPRAFTYETTPLYQGAQTLTSANYFVSSFDDPSSAAGWWWMMLLYVPAVTQASNIIAGANNATSGFDVRFANNNGAFSWQMGDGTTYSAGPNTGTATNRINLLTGVWDAGALRQRTYANALEAGTGAVRAGYAPAAGVKLNLGRSPRDPASAGGSRVLLGYAQGLGVPTLEQITAARDLISSTDAMQTIAGLTTSVFVDLTQDIVGGGGAIPASVPNRGTLGGTFTRTGAPAVFPHYARVYSW